MADLEKTVAIIFKGDDQLSTTVRSINRSFSDFSSMAQTVASPLANIAEGVIAADTALAAMAVGGMALAIREAGSFGDSFNEIATLINAPQEALDEFRRDIVEYAKDSTASFEDINAATYSAISAGTDYSNSLQLLASSERLATAGKADLEATTRLLASSLNAYGDGVDQATRYSDAFFTTVKYGQTTLPELAEGLSQVTGLAATADVPIEELGAALAALTGYGDPTTAALTKVKGILAAVIKPSETAAATAKQLGIDFSLTALKADGLAGFLQKVYDAADGDAAVMTKLFGRVEALSGALVLGADNSGKYADALAAMNESAGATEAAFAKMAENFNQVNQTIANNVRAVLITLGDEMLGGYIEIAGGITDVFRQVEQSIDDGVFDSLFDAFDEFVGQISVFMGELATAMPDALAQLDFSGFLDALRDLGGAIGGLFGDVDLTTADDLADVMQEIIDTGEALIRVTTGMAMAFAPYLDALRQAVGDVNSWDAETQAAFGRVLVAAEGIVRAGTLVGLAFATIAESGADIRDVTNVVYGLMQGVYNYGQMMMDAVAGSVVGVLQTVVGVMADLADALDFLPGMEGLAESLSGAGSSLNNLGRAIAATRAENVDDMFDGFSRAADGFAGSAGEAATASGQMARAVREIPEEKTTFLEFSDDIAREDVEEFERFLLDRINSDGTTIEILPIIPPDGTILDEINQMMDRAQSAADSDPVNLPVETDTEAAEQAIERLKLQFSLAEESLKWEAQIEITQAQEATKRLEAAFASVNVGIQSTGETLVGLFANLGNVEEFTQKWLAEDAIRQEIDLRQQSFQSQQGLIASMKELNQLKSERLRSGDALITISTEGLTPALEMVLWNIVEKIQMRVIESGSDALIDLGSFGGV